MHTTIDTSSDRRRAPAPSRRARWADLVVLIAASAVLGFAFPSFAGADSIAFVRAGDVWLATGDLSREYRVTFTGGYSDVSQADDGTMIALKGVRLHRLDRAGNVVADFDTPVSDTRPAGQRVFYGPFDPAISPDGTKVAYTYYYMTQSQNPGCFPPTCVTTINEGGTGYSHADRQTAWDEPGLGKHSGWRHPSWISNDDVLISDPTHLPNTDVLTDTIGDQGVPIKEWFSDNGTAHLAGGDVSRTGTKLAFVAGQSDEQLRVYRMSGLPPALPEACLNYTGPAGGHYGVPSWSPDAARLAFADADGIKVVSIPDFAGGCTTAGASPTAPLAIPGGSEPDWGPAGVPPRRPDPAGAAAGAGAPGSGAGPGAGAARVSVAAKRLRAALRTGLRVRISGAKPGRIVVKARAGRTVVASGTGTARADGRASLVLRFTATGRARLQAKRRVTLSVGGTGLVTRAITLKR